MSITKITDPAAVPAAVADYTAQNTHSERLLGNAVQPFPIDGSNIKKGSLFNIGGDMFYCDADTAITGTPSDYVKLTVTGTDAAPSFVATLSGVTWSDAYNGYYSGGDLHVFSGSDKNTLLSKGLNAVVLTHYTTTTVPAIAVGSATEINGPTYINLVEVAITGATSDSTWYDILLTPSGTTFTASFVARGTGVWSDTKRGLYSGNSRVVACVYKDAGGNFIDKNILTVINRSVGIRVKIGDWDMSASLYIDVAHGLSDTNIRSISVMINRDVVGLIYDFASSISHTGGDNISRTITISPSNIRISRDTGGLFDSADFNSLSFNRGWVTITYEV